MKADAYLPVWVHHLPVSQLFDLRGTLHESVQHYVKLGVVRVVAGPESCHLSIDVKRPYYRTSKLIEVLSLEMGAA